MHCLYLSQACSEKGGFEAPDHPGTTPFPTHPAAFCLTPKRRCCEPALGCFSSSFLNQQQPKEGEMEMQSQCR